MLLCFFGLSCVYAFVHLSMFACVLVCLCIFVDVYARISSVRACVFCFFVVNVLCLCKLVYVLLCSCVLFLMCACMYLFVHRHIGPSFCLC